MDQLARASKRLRTDSDPPDDHHPLTLPKPSTPWFDDGNIILEAELTQFKVYRGILSANSDVFRDMFALARGGGSEGEEVDGCSVVHVSDKAEDLRYVLQVLHDSKL